MTLALELGIIYCAQLLRLLKQCAVIAVEFFNSVSLLPHKYALISKCISFPFCKVTVSYDTDKKTITYLAKEAPFLEIMCKYI
jgi:hypothetical protein